MGTWGTGVFSNDLASDLRADYREAITDGKEHSDAMDLLSKSYRESLADPEEAPVFWIALAAVAWDLGRLDDNLRTKAITVIKDGGDLERWEDPRDRRARQAVLGKLAEKLSRPQKPPTKLKRKPRFVTDWKLDEVIGFQQRTGRWILLHVVGINNTEFGDFPVVNLLDWSRKSLPPDQRELERAQIIWLPATKDLQVSRRKDLSLFVDDKLIKSGRIKRWNTYLKRRSSLMDSITSLMSRKSADPLSCIGPEFLEHDFSSQGQK